MVALGRLLAALACNSPQAGRREVLPATLQIIQQNYSNDMKNLIAFVFNYFQIFFWALSAAFECLRCITGSC